MDRNQRLFLDMPDEIILEVLVRLISPDRKNVRLTCKRLYALATTDRFCKDEKIIWSEEFGRLFSGPSSLDSRSHYNLTIDEDKVSQPSSIIPFFEKNGDKVHELDISYKCSHPGLLESLITHCGELHSVYLEVENGPVQGSDLFTQKPKMIVRPKVTLLQLKLLPQHQPSIYFRQIVSVFPNIKYLQINLQPHSVEVACYCKDAGSEYLDIIDDVMKLGSQLVTLQLLFMGRHLLAKGPQFFSGFPNLKCLYIIPSDLHYKETKSIYSILQDLEIDGVSDDYTCPIFLLLRNNTLKYLTLNSMAKVILDTDVFKELVSSQLKKISFVNCFHIDSSLILSPDFPLQANQTVTDLSFICCKYHPISTTESTLLLFCTYFVGLVHLQLQSIPLTSEILQCIFQNQENLRSLMLDSCSKWTEFGFCGGGDCHKFKHSINKLQKLEHLSLTGLPSRLFELDDFKKAFNLPRLKYLNIGLSYVSTKPDQVCPVIPVNIFESCSNLEALKVTDRAIPSTQNLASLFTNLKRLNFLHYDNVYECSPTAYINSQYFFIQASDFGEQSCYNEELGRMVVKNKEGKKSLYVPRITTSYAIDWIYIHTSSRD